MVPLTAVNPKMESTSSDFSFALLKVLVALSLSEPILRFEVDKAVVYWGKLKRLYVLGNFTSMAKLQSLLHASEDTKVIPLQAYNSSLCLEILQQKKSRDQTVYLMSNGAILEMAFSISFLIDLHSMQD